MSVMPKIFDPSNKNEYGKIIVSLRINNQEILAEVVGQSGTNDEFLLIRDPYVLIMRVHPNGGVEAVFPQWGLGQTKGQEMTINMNTLSAFCLCTNPEVLAKYISIVTGIEVAPPNMRFQPPPGSMGPGRDPEGSKPGQIFDISGKPVK
jgi:hypothetical protein